MKIKRIHTPLSEDQIRGLKAGDQVRISGTIYTARDAAHAKMAEALEKGQPLPMELEGALIYYAGPTPAKPGMPVGSLGPTTSGRMDAFAPRLLTQGLKGMMGKGPRSQEVQEAVVRYGAVYFAALGGAGALLAKHVKRREVVAYPELQSEAVARLEVEDFPAIVAMDCQGGDYYKLGPWQYQREQEGRA
ncbi:MAG: Fe-S-containing hydro-lyase [Clostridiales bacterium]|nr:Fe-S-containing hydro-lyase [Clostridiales bacterium]